MPARIREELNHSPMWYREHCRDEDGGNPMYRALFDSDMKRVEADGQRQSYLEQIDLYETAWREAEAGQHGDDMFGEIQEVYLREKRAGFVPQIEYAREPFRSLARIMDKHALSTTEVATFLKWKAKSDNVAKARAAKKTSPKGEKERARQKQLAALFGDKKWKPPLKGGF